MTECMRNVISKTCWKEPLELEYYSEHQCRNWTRRSGRSLGSGNHMNGEQCMGLLHSFSLVSVGTYKQRITSEIQCY